MELAALLAASLKNTEIENSLLTSHLRLIQLQHRYKDEVQMKYVMLCVPIH